MQVVNDERVLVTIELRPHVGLEQATRFSKSDREVDVRQGVQGPLGQDEIPVTAVAKLVLRVKGAVPAEPLGEQLHLVFMTQRRHALSYLLQQDDVRLRRFDDGHRPSQVVSAVDAADALVDIPRHDANRGRRLWRIHVG